MTAAARAHGDLVAQLLRASWVDENGVTKPLTAADLRVVAPYNAQVNRLAAQLEPLGVPVGTVDRFQGHGDLLNGHVATGGCPSRHGIPLLSEPAERRNISSSVRRVYCGHPALIDRQCRTPRQVHLANGLCRFVELACLRKPSRSQ